MTRAKDAVKAAAPAHNGEPTFLVAEVKRASYELFKIPRQVAVGAMTLAGKLDTDFITVSDFRVAVATFLHRPAK